MLTKVKLFLVDDHYMIVEGIYSLLNKELNIEWLGHAMNAESCLAFLRNIRPDVIFMDINLPGKNGIELCREVKQLYPDVFIIALTTFNQQSFVSRMMDNGASGYVLKNATREELLLAIQTVMRGGTYLSFEIAMNIEGGDSPGRPVITRREKEVLELIANGFTTQEIASKLFVSEATVETHRKNLLTKFSVRNVASLVKAAMQWQMLGE